MRIGPQEVPDCLGIIRSKSVFAIDLGPSPERIEFRLSVRDIREHVVRVICGVPGVQEIKIISDMGSLVGLCLFASSPSEIKRHLDTGITRRALRYADETVKPLARQICKTYMHAIRFSFSSIRCGRRPHIGLLGVQVLLASGFELV